MTAPHTKCAADAIATLPSSCHKLVMNLELEEEREVNTCVEDVRWKGLVDELRQHAKVTQLVVRLRRRTDWDTDWHEERE